jgi:hypothetical protein
MIAVQAVHALEEFRFEFWNVFPPMRAVYGRLPDHGELVFVAFHATLLGFGGWCYFRWVRGGGEAAHRVIALWTAIQSVTVLLHVAWFLTAPGYQPGLATLPLFLATIALALVALKRSQDSSTK